MCQSLHLLQRFSWRGLFCFRRRCYRTDKVGNIALPIGKVSFGKEKLAENFKTVYDALLKIRPATVKGAYVKNISVSSTMGPGIKIDPELK